MSNKVNPPVKVFSGNEIVPFSSVYNDKAISELGLLPSYINDFIKTTRPRFIHGFDILYHDVSDSNNLYIRLSPGCCIINKSVAFIKTDTVLTLGIDDAWLDYNGYVVVDFYYSSVEKTYSITIYFVRDDGEIFPTETVFNPDDDHVIVALIKLKNLNGRIASVDATKSNIRRGIRIKSKTFYVYGYYPISSDVDSGELLSAIIASHFIVPTKIDNETITLNLVNTNDIPIDYNPNSYSPQDTSIISHLRGIDSELENVKIIVDRIKITSDMNNGGRFYITTSKKMDQTRFDKSVMIVHNGISLIPGDDYLFVTENLVEITNPDIMVDDIISFCYYYII